MRINTNVSSLVAQEASVNTSKNLASSLEKLSSGLRINKASDDASGLAIADKLRTQASSINQGISNGNSAITLLQIADKSMGEQSNILDTIKSKLIQANTDTTSADGREAIRKDVAKLLEQLDNIAKQTNYNGNVLLQAGYDSQGSSNGLTFQIGESENDIIKNTAIQSNTLGLGLAQAEEHTVKITAQNDTNYTLDLDGTQVSYVSDSNATVDEIHAGLKSAIEANATTAGKFSVAPQVTSGDQNLVIKSTANNDSFYVSSAVGADTAGLSAVTPTPAVNGVHTTGNLVAFTTAGDKSSIVLDGQKISVTEGETVNAVAITSTATVAEQTAALKYKIESDATLNAKYTVAVAGSGLTITAKDGSFDPVVSSVTDRAGASKLGSLTAGTTEKNSTEITPANNTEYQLTVGTEKVTYVSDSTATINEIHAGLKAAIEANKVISAAYKVNAQTSSGDATFEIEAKRANTNTATLTARTALTNTNLVDSTTKDAGDGKSLNDLKNLAIGGLTRATSNEFQTVVDDAITDLNGYRGDIGSTQNQVESAVRNLMTQATNVKAAESVIRDVDYAAESANFNKQNIISQAGSYAISQANAVQQNVLRLLQ